ncbi:hypothetical protein L596_009014 [Steinernema carpocapsae]|uniref:Uncharacterized protein n=1 Tax=Steinernema carpocapsae TaxID=34508 RepID=A0A4U5PFB0_STECR|nr:hypothetical protein L596_009014 [Steinernema carpocapsae]
MKKIGFEQDRTRDLKTGRPDHYVDTTHACVDDVSRSHCVQIIGFGLTFMLCFTPLNPNYNRCNFALFLVIPWPASVLNLSW